MPISVCIVDDSSEIRSALEQIIRLEEGYLLLGSFSEPSEAIMGIPQLKPDVVLMDINLGFDEESGIDCIKAIKPYYPDILFLMCTIYDADEKIFEALRAGASGYILKKTTPQKLLEAIKELYEGGAPMSSQIARKVVNAFQPNGMAKAQSQAAKRIPVLSNRENQILELLSRGLLYKEIASSLFISQETVRKHVYHIYEKMHVNNRVEAVNKFYRR